MNNQEDIEFAAKLNPYPNLFSNNNHKSKNKIQLQTQTRDQDQVQALVQV